MKSEPTARERVDLGAGRGEEVLGASPKRDVANRCLGPECFLRLRPEVQPRLELQGGRDAAEIGEHAEADRPVEIVRTHVRERAAQGAKPDARIRRGFLRRQARCGEQKNQNRALHGSPWLRPWSRRAATRSSRQLPPL